MKWPTFMVGGLLLAVAIVAGIQSSQLSYWTMLGPGPGFFPMWLSGALGALSVVLMVRSLRSSDGALPAGFLSDGPGRLKMGFIVTALVGVVLLLDRAGFRLTVLAMYLLVLYGLGRRDWVLTPLIALAGSFGMFHIFTQWLDVSLPTGPWGW
jgi:putative tricarboxylic transport membrane protein